MLVNGKKIKELRGDRPPEALALALGIKIRRLQQIESAIIVKMNINVAKAAAKFLGVPLKDIAA